MAVPRKRKKLADTAEALKKQKAGNAKQSGRKPVVRTKSKAASSKIDHAFEIIDHMEQENGSAESGSTAPSSNRRPETGQSASPSGPFGFRFHISLDAVMPDNSREDRHRSSLLDIGLTIPFFWKMPIIGGIARKIVKNIRTVRI